MNAVISTDMLNFFSKVGLRFFICFYFLLSTDLAITQVSTNEDLLPLDGFVTPRANSAHNQSTKALSVFKDCDVCPAMVVIPAGSFLMGSPPDPEQDPFSNSKPEKKGQESEKPQHHVHVQSFAIGKYEVTQEEWYAVMGKNPSKNKGRTLPVEYVSWDEAQLFVQKLSQKTGNKYRLPSEAEWEYAARGGSSTLYPWGNSDNELHVYAWFSAIANATNPVGLKNPNSWGLFDMIGNVWEWTQDCYHSNYLGAPFDGSSWTSGDCSQRILRGGAWTNPTRDLRSAIRGKSANANRDFSVGLRVAKDL